MSTYCTGVYIDTSLLNQGISGEVHKAIAHIFICLHDSWSDYNFWVLLLPKTTAPRRCNLKERTTANANASFQSRWKVNRPIW